jgi:hypothetical protein
LPRREIGSDSVLAFTHLVCGDAWRSAVSVPLRARVVTSAQVLVPIGPALALMTTSGGTRREIWMEHDDG